MLAPRAIESKTREIVFFDLWKQRKSYSWHTTTGYFWKQCLWCRHGQLFDACSISRRIKHTSILLIDGDAGGMVATVAGAVVALVCHISTTVHMWVTNKISFHRSWQNLLCLVWNHCAVPVYHFPQKTPFLYIFIEKYMFLINKIDSRLLFDTLKTLFDWLQMIYILKIKAKNIDHQI